jgi:hypothetical protein
MLPTSLRQTEKAFFEAEPNSLFYLHRKLPDADAREAMKDYMLSQENIRDVIRLPDELSACGNDGITSRVMKAGDPEMVKFKRCTIKTTIRCGRMIDSWKEARTVLICTKSDHEALKTWRPIPITNCVSRIYTCLKARAFTQVNLQQKI